MSLIISFLRQYYIFSSPIGANKRTNVTAEMTEFFNKSMRLLLYHELPTREFPVNFRNTAFGQTKLPAIVCYCVFILNHGFQQCEDLIS